MPSCSWTLDRAIGEGALLAPGGQVLYRASMGIGLLRNRRIIPVV
jgi:hypothetical protein